MISLKRNSVSLEAFFVLTALTLFTRPIMAQTYLGAGYAEAVIDDNFYIVNGTVVSVQREEKLGKSRWQVVPTLHTALLFNDRTYDNVSGHTTTLSLSSPVSFNLIQSERITVAPYVGPFVSWLFSYREGAPFFLEPRQINRWFVGGETGLSVSFNFTDQWGVRLIPISAQFGNDFYRQAMFTLSFKL